MIAEERQVLMLVMERRLEERADHDLAELTLFFRRNQTTQVEEPRAPRPRISAAPHGVPLAVIGAVDIPRRFEPRLSVRELHALPLPQTGERGHVAVVRAMNDEIVHVLDRRELSRRLVLRVDGGDGDDGLDVEVEVEFHLRVIRIARQSIERSRMADRLAAA